VATATATKPRAIATMPAIQVFVIVDFRIRTLLEALATKFASPFSL
jgi:hypothetical protein